MSGLNFDDNKGTSFWSRREGYIAMAVIAGLAIFGIGHIDSFMQHINNIVTSTANTIYTLVGLGLFLLILFDKKAQNVALLGYRLILRWTVGLFISVDPEGILQDTIDDAKREREKIFEQINRASGAKGELEKQISDNTKNAEQKLREAKAARNQGEEDYAKVYANEAAGLRDMNTRLIPLQQNLDRVITFMEKVYKNSGIMIADMENTVRLKKLEYKTVKAGHGALKSALRIFKGDPEKQMMYDKAMDYINADMGQKLGEMKLAMKMTKDLMTSIDIRDAAQSEKGLEILDQFEKGDFKLVSEGKNLDYDLPSLNSKKPQTINITPEPKKIGSNYSKLLGDE